MIYLRKLLDMFFLSMVPSLISFLLMSQFMGYTTWLITCIISVLIFFVGNALLIRRFVRDIKSVSTYYTVWLITFAVYTAGGALCLWKAWSYPFTWIYFHARIIQTAAMPVTDIPMWISFAVSMAAFLALILIGRPVFYRLYQRELVIREADERESRRLAREEYHRRKDAEADVLGADGDEEVRRHYSSRSQHHRRRSSSGNEVYSMRRYRKMKRMGDVDSAPRGKQIGRQRVSGRKTTRKISEAILSIGSYEFYQSLADKVALGNDPWPIIKTYIKRKLNLSIRTGKR